MFGEIIIIVLRVLHSCSRRGDKLRVLFSCKVVIVVLSVLCSCVGNRDNCTENIVFMCGE